MAGFQSIAASHVGMVRSNNQDSGFAGNQIYLVADGMGPMSYAIAGTSRDRTSTVRLNPISC